MVKFLPKFPQSFYIVFFDDSLTMREAANVDDAVAVKKWDHHEFFREFVLPCFLGSWRIQTLPQDTLSLSLKTITVDSALVTGYQRSKALGCEDK